MAPAQSYLEGVVLDPDEEPEPGIHVKAVRREPSVFSEAGTIFWSDRTGEDGSFSVFAEPGVTVLGIATDDCASAGFLGADGGIAYNRLDARTFRVGMESVTGIVIRLPAEPDELCDLFVERTQWWR